MALATKVLLALLNAVPALVQLWREHRKQRRTHEKDKAVDDDTMREWSNRFGQLRDDTYSDPAARCLCDTTIDCDPLNSPCMGGGGVPAKDGSSKTTEVP